MPTLTLPLSNNPSFVLLSLALLRGDQVNWVSAANELAEPEYDGVKGTEQVRARLEQGVPGKEVSGGGGIMKGLDGEREEMHDIGYAL